MSSTTACEREGFTGKRWQESGSCRGMDSSVFFHPDGERGSARSSRVRRAKQICRACQVLELCRSYALTVGEPYGIWGGLSERERRTLRQQRSGIGQSAKLSRKLDVA
ncbi:WhiB family transcriptional regulator [Nocardia sp. NPDC005978]|uniref:WhiB family transcriptional regulator n=1 Tax=Nocardia sp. NPDC005978 TaxID=3156725 RepID=UPI0033B40F40